VSTIQNLFEQAQLAEAAYANFIDPQTGLPYTTTKGITDALQDHSNNLNFSTAQATAFANEWRVVDQYTIPTGMLGLSGSGFSATVFQNIATGAYTFAARGTEPNYTDLLGTDLSGVVADGIAIEQVIDMYNYWQSLTNLGVYQAAYLDTLTVETLELKTLWAQTLLPGGLDSYNNYVAQLHSAGIIVNMGLYGPTAQQVQFGNSDTVLANTPLAWGSNTLSGATAVDVTGHSMGGHLAMAFSRLFPGATADVVAVNGAGFNFANGNVDTLFARLGGAAGFDAGKITNAVGTAGWYLTSQDWLFMQQPAGRTDIYTESSGRDQTIGHGKEQMTDSLAVYNLFAQLDPTLNTNPNGLQTITDILKAESSVAANSLESAMTALGTLFGVANSTFTGNAFDADRNKLYNAIAGFNSIINEPNTVDPTIQSLVGMDAATLAANAQSGIAYRYALVNANPFVALGLDYSGLNQNGELDLYNATTHTGDLTGQYLTDRAGYLAELIRYNTVDGLSSTLQDTRYHDLATNTTLTPINAELNRVTFGSAADEAFSGSGGNDHLYGGAGNDYIDGGAGNDYIEGNAGADTLTGGAGNDMLLGGAGNDTYQYTGGANTTLNGLDTILDSDGNGSIVVDGATLAGGAQYGDSRVHRDGSGNLYVNIDQGLIIDGNMLIEGYNSSQGNHMGLTMTGAVADAAPVTTNTINGDLAPTDQNPNTPGIQAALDAQGNLIGTAGPYEDILIGTAAADHIIGGELNDDIGGRGGNDWIDGGSGNDLVYGEAGNDIIEGGAGSDILSGGADNDLIYGNVKISAADAITQGNAVNLNGDTGTGLKGDWLSGGAGDDQLIAGADNDVLAGGGGNDLIIAGAGDDYILGDAEYTPQYISETDPRYSAGNSDWFHSSADTFDWTITPQANGDILFQPVDGLLNPSDFGADVIYAGDGKDVAWGGFGNDVIFGEGGDDCLHLEDLSVLSGVEMDTLKDNGTHRARCDVLFGREGSEAANDASYANTFERRWA
jgi:Ca2+-binding RTX toxin-like protein